MGDWQTAAINQKNWKIKQLQREVAHLKGLLEVRGQPACQTCKAATLEVELAHSSRDSWERLADKNLMFACLFLVLLAGGTSGDFLRMVEWNVKSL